MITRIVLFLLTNLSVTIIFGSILFFTGIKANSTHGLMILSVFVGFSGSIVSLLLSKWIAVQSVKGHIIKYPKDKFESWIFNTVHQQAKTVGITPPDILIYYTLEVNAFATGCSKNNALLALSTGLLKSMNKDNIEAVIAHEMSHITNGDMVTLTLLQGVVNTFVFFISNIITHTITNILSGGNKQSVYMKYGSFLINLVLSTVLQIIFGVLASMIVMRYSRHREFRADADSTKLVGSKKMIDALERFKNICEPTVSSNMNVHCIHGKSKSILNLFSSHPPTQDRIIALHNKTYM